MNDTLNDLIDLLEQSIDVFLYFSSHQSEYTTLVNQHPDLAPVPITMLSILEGLGMSKYEPIDSLLSTLNINKIPLTVVPINNIEYDTLMSRPYKYPPKSQAWRILVNGEPEFIVPYGYHPIKYYIRYVRTPQEVDLSTEDKTCELPDFLIDEVIQRAVELAKNAWEGNLESEKTFGERSE